MNLRFSVMRGGIQLVNCSRTDDCFTELSVFYFHAKIDWFDQLSKTGTCFKSKCPCISALNSVRTELDKVSAEHNVSLRITTWKNV